MSAKTTGFRSRADLGMRKPKSVSRNITPGGGGVAAHWEGPKMGHTAKTPHSECEAAWRGIQKYHMDGQGWADIAYTGGYCQHGKALAGRGFGVRTAANGTNTGNQSYYAFCFLGGQGDFPTQEAINCLEWWVREARIHGGAGLRVRPHSAFKSTACPGPQIRAAAATLDGRVIGSGGGGDTTTTTGGTLDRAKTKAIQAALHVTVDGVLGSITVAANAAVVGRRFIPNGVKWLQARVGTPQDGDWGPRSEAARIVTIQRLQRALGVADDGAWGHRTQGAWETYANANVNR